MTDSEGEAHVKPPPAGAGDAYDPHFGRFLASSDYFRDLLSKAMSKGFMKDVFIGGTAVCERFASDEMGRELIQPWPRLVIMLSGAQRYAISAEGRRLDLKLTAGDLLFWTDHAWQIDFWDETCSFLGLVYRERTLRFLLVEHKAGPRASPSCYFHTPSPISGPALPLLKCLHMLAESGLGGSTASRSCVLALLDLSLRHLSCSAKPSHGGGKALRTWQRIMDYVKERYGDRINRKSIAQELGLHPNYISSLAMKETGRSFQEIVESLRMEEARRLLSGGQLKMERVASICGFGGANYFTTAFRKANGVSPAKYRDSLRKRQP